MGERGGSRQSVQWQDSWDEGGSPGQPGGTSKESKGPANPFAMPSDEEIFLLRDQERERKKAVLT